MTRNRNRKFTQSSRERVENFHTWSETISSTPCTVCILGGGFGGLYTALHLQKYRFFKRSECQLILVEPKDHFLFTPLLYELITDELEIWEIAPSLQNLLNHTSVNHCQDWVHFVDLKQRYVELQNKQIIPYDYLVIALGRESRLGTVPGVLTHAVPFRTLADAKHLDQKLQSLEQTSTYCQVAIVGAGAGGVEIACKVADRLGRQGEVFLLDRGDAILKTFPRDIRRAALSALGKRQVHIITNTTVEAIAANQLTYTQAAKVTALAVDLVIWAGGNQPPSWLHRLPVSQNERGQLITQPTLQLPQFPEVFVLGDSAAVKGDPMPVTAQVAHQQAPIAAQNLNAVARQQPLRNFRYNHLGEMMTLGQHVGLVSSLGITVAGPLAGVIRLLAYLQRLPTAGHKWRVFKYRMSYYFKALTHWKP